MLWLLSPSPEQEDDEFTHATVHPYILELQWLGFRNTKYSTTRWLIRAAIPS